MALKNQGMFGFGSKGIPIRDQWGGNGLLGFWNGQGSNLPFQKPIFNQWGSYQNALGQQNRQSAWGNLMGASGINPLATATMLGPRMQNAMRIIGAVSLGNARRSTANNAINSIARILGIGPGGGAGSSPPQLTDFNFYDPAGSRIGGASLTGQIDVPVQNNVNQVWSPNLASRARESLMNTAGGEGAPTFTGNPELDRQYQDLPVSLANRAAVGLDLTGQQGAANYLLNAQRAQAGLGRGFQGLLNRVAGQNLTDNLQRDLMMIDALRRMYFGAQNSWPSTPFPTTFNPFV